ncbi:DUF6514 family protein [Dysosmobacter sp.]|uniref:DUF6514 family protein n=1 Tax=Dysosmobacter sp. TaxID=2591382 RepID=UPI002A8F4D63|nr:DUF6514 family protein [Dysosmobacter sp.]MDY3985222.1 DUF6514 family protein [Dysosmobacter sp.]
MERSLTAITRLNGFLIHYYLLRDRCGPSYGLAVSYRGEEAVFSDLAVSEGAVRELLAAMGRGSVTPATARDIVEDWLLR